MVIPFQVFPMTNTGTGDGYCSHRGLFYRHGNGMLAARHNGLIAHYGAVDVHSLCINVTEIERGA